jgi:hypothetical protein
MRSANWSSYDRRFDEKRVENGHSQVLVREILGGIVLNNLAGAEDSLINYKKSYRKDREVEKGEKKERGEIVGSARKKGYVIRLELRQS